MYVNLLRSEKRLESVECLNVLGVKIREFWQRSQVKGGVVKLLVF